MRVLEFQSRGAQPPPARLSGVLAALAQKCSKAGELAPVPVSRGLRIP